MNFDLLIILIPNTLFLAVAYYAFTQKVKETVDAKLKDYEAAHKEEIKIVKQSFADIVDKIEIRYEQRINLIDSKLHSTEENLTQTREITKVLETHNTHILKSIDTISDNVVKIHNRLDRALRGTQ